MQTFRIAYISRDDRNMPKNTNVIASDEKDAINLFEGDMKSQGYRKKDFWITEIEPDGIIAGHRISIAHGEKVSA